MNRTGFALVVVALASCGGQSPPPVEVDLGGEWRSVIESPGGELPFGLRIVEQDGTKLAVAELRTWYGSSAVRNEI
jgi:hypothetical protein